MKTLLLASVAAIALPSAAFAQTAPETATPAAATAAAETTDVNEILVTATRRSQVLSDVPIAVSAVSAEQLKNSGGSDIRQLNQLAPSLLVSSATNENAGVARIRGIGTVGENAGLESSVAVFIDGVYRSRTGVGLTDLGEVERIEVLRGPQGTLFGRNASAGLLNIITAKPKFDAGGTAEATYGNYDNIRLVGSLTGPIIADKLAARIDGVYHKRDGFVTDVISGRDTANRDRFLVRGQLLFTPTDDVSLRLIGDYNQKREECCAAAFISPTRNVSRDAGGNLVFTPNSVQALLSSAAFGGIYVLPTDGSAYERRVSITPGRSYDQRTNDWGVSGELNWKLGDVNLTSITAYRKYKNISAQDADFNNVDILYRDNQLRQFETFTQELRLQGTAFDDRLDYLFGGYFAKETLTTADDIKYGADYERYVNAQIGGTLPLLASLVGYTPPAGQSLLNGTGITRADFKQKSTNYAFFTHNVVQIIPDKVSLTLGGRYTHEEKKLDTAFASNNNLCGALRRAPAFAPPFNALNAARAGATALSCVINNTSGPGFSSSDPGGTKTESRVTGTAVLSIKPTDRLLTYLSYSRGYKAGGYNLDTSALNAAAPSPFNLQFQPEEVNAFEIGGKLDLREFKLNVAAFYQTFKNFQLNTFNGVNFEVSNIASCKDSLGGRDRDLVGGNSACAADSVKDGVTTRGVEIEAFMFPAKNVTVTSGFTWARTKYKDDLTGLGGVSLAPTLFQLPGQQLSNAPEYVVTGSFAWTPEINDRFSALTYIDFRYMSAVNTGSDLDREKIQPGFLVVNARVGLYGPERRWGIELWSQNLLNEKYQQIAADAPLQGSGTVNAVARGLSASANQLFITFPAEPRTYGVTVRTKF